MKKVSKITIIAFLNGLLFTIPYYFNNLFFLIFFAFVPLLCFINREKSTIKQIYYSFVCVFIWGSTSLIWIYNDDIPIIFSSIGIFLFVLIAFFPFFIHVLIVNKLKISLRVKYLLFSLIWLLVEWLSFEWELAFPFLSLGYYLGNNFWLIQWYCFTGVLGGSLWVLLVNFCVVLLINKWFLKFTNIILILIIAFPFVISMFVIYTAKNNSRQTMDVIILNLNRDNKMCCQRTNMYYAIDLLYQQNIYKNIDIIVLPENLCSLSACSIPYNSYFSLIKQWLIQNAQNAIVIFGAETQDITKKSHFNNDTLFNTALCCDSSGFTNFRNKVRFVPFGEFIPYQTIFGRIPNIKEYVQHNLYSKAEYDNIFKVNNVNILPLICYELYFNSEIARYIKEKDIGLILCISNDYSCQSEVLSDQFIRMARIQAISCRKSIVKSTTQGYSFAISPDGTIIAKSRYNFTEFIESSVPINNTKTIFVRFGNIVIIGIWCILFVGVCLSKRLFKK